MNDQRPTIRSIAAAAGVSKSLVSLVLQGSSRVAPGTRDRILQAMEDAGYRPNASAQSLASRRTNLIGVILSNLRNPWHADFLDAFSGVARESGKRVVLGDCNRRVERLEDLVDSYLQMRVEALVLVGEIPFSPAIERGAKEVPLAVVGTREHDFPFASLFASDDDFGARLAAEHLLTMGHRQIAHIAGRNRVGTIRREAFCAALADAGAPPPRVEECELSEAGGFEAMSRLLLADPTLTAVFAANDLSALGALTAMSSRNLACPDDVSVVGYDNSAFSRLGAISLTTVDIGVGETGRDAARHVIRQIEERSAPVSALTVPHLVLRSSTRSLT